MSATDKLRKDARVTISFLSRLKKNTDNDRLLQSIDDCIDLAKRLA